MDDYPFIGQTQINKYTYLEAVRGIASLIVVLTHFMSAFYPSAIFGSRYQAHGSWESNFTTTPLSLMFSGDFAVCVFFVLSGYVLSLPYFGKTARETNSLLSALVKRPIRLGGLVFASILISLCLTSFGWFFNSSVSSFSGSIPWFRDYYSRGTPGLLLLLRDLSTRLFSVGSNYNPPLWTIEIELYGSFLTYSFVLLFRRSGLRSLAYAIALVLLQGTLYHGFIFGILIADVAKNFPHFWVKLSRPVFSIPFLFLGLVFASHPNYALRPDLANSLYSFFPRLPLLGGSYAMLGALFVFLGILLNSRIQVFLSGRIFAYLGRISFAVYVIHFLILGSVSSWLFIQLEPMLNYDANCAIVALSYIVLTFLTAHWLTVYIDEPTTKLASGMARIYLKSLSQKEEQREVDPC